MRGPHFSADDWAKDLGARTNVAPLALAPAPHRTVILAGAVLPFGVTGAVCFDHVQQLIGVFI